MIIPLYKKSHNVLYAGGIIFEGAGDKAYFFVEDHQVVITPDAKGHIIDCDCKYCSLHPAGMCYHKAAVIAELVRLKGVIG